MKPKENAAMEVTSSKEDKKNKAPENIMKLIAELGAKLRECTQMHKRIMIAIQKIQETPLDENTMEELPDENSIYAEMKEPAIEKGMDFSYYADQFLSVNAFGKTHAYYYVIRRLQKWCEEQDISIDQLNGENIKEFEKSVEGTVAPSSVSSYMRAVYYFCQWLLEKGIIAEHPLPNLGSLAIKDMESFVTRNFLSLSDIQKLFQYLKERIEEPSLRITALRDRAIITLMLYNFVTESKLLELCIEDIEFEDDSCLLYLRDKDQEFKVHIHPNAVNYIEEYLEVVNNSNLQDGDPLFPQTVGNGKNKRLTNHKMKEFSSEFLSRIGRNSQLSKRLSCLQLRYSGLLGRLCADPDILELKLPRKRRILGPIPENAFAQCRAMIERYPQYENLRELFETEPDLDQPLQDFIRSSGIFRLPKSKDE